MEEEKEGTTVGEEYYCKNCGNKVRVERAGHGKLTCCSLPMEKI